MQTNTFVTLSSRIAMIDLVASASTDRGWIWLHTHSQTNYTIRMIEIQNLSKNIGKRRIVNDLSLSIKKGTVFGFLGPNGAGKTTTIKMLVGLNRPTSGSIQIDGKAPTDSITRETIGFMPEAPYFYDHLTGLEFLRFCGQLFHTPKTEDDYTSLLHMVGLSEAKDRRVTTYSKGMKQRLGFAQALVNDPEYVFLDEPLDGLDPIGRRELKKIIVGLKKEGRTIFFNSHILFDTEELCDEIGILHRGSLLYAGPVTTFTKGHSLEEAFVTTIENLDSTI